MTSLPTDFAQRYCAVLRQHVAHSGEGALHLAYELGREALTAGVGVLDIVDEHHRQLFKLAEARAARDLPSVLRQGGEILAECLSAFEMRLRGVEEANAELASAHEHLQAEMAERRRAEEALVHAQKLQAVGLLAGGVAHNFNNLLTVILGNLELAVRRVGDEPKLQRYLDAARKGAEKGAQVAQQLLTFSRKQRLTPRVLDVSAWMGELTTLLSSAVRADIAVDCRAPPDVDKVFVDSSQLDLAVLNLAVNARDAMPTGGRLTIAARNAHVENASLALSGDYVVIEVADTGQGIAPEVLPHIIEPFFTTKEPGAGTGLGLSQVHGFVNQSGGALDVESEPGEGTTVRLYLPAITGAAAASEPEAQVSDTSRSGRILVVEDDPQVGELAAAMLETDGYSVVLVDRPQAALERLDRGERFDLVFSDIIMPGGMDGVRFAEDVRRRKPRLPILLASGYSEAIGQADTKGLPFIQKPYRSEELRSRIDELLSDPPSGDRARQRVTGR